MEKNKVIYGFDILKFIMALVVVNIHTELINVADGYQNVQYAWAFISDLAVPIFFVLSSYFLFRKQRNCIKGKASILKKYIIRLLKLYGYWCIVLLPAILKLWHSEYLNVPIVEAVSLFFKNTLFAYQFGASWFLGALLLGVPLIWFLYKILGDRFLWVIPLIVYIYIFMPDDHKVIYDWYKNNLQTPNLSFPAALLWIAIGHYFSHPKVTSMIEYCKTKYFVIVILIMMVLSIFLPKERYLFIIPGVISTVVLGYRMPRAQKIWRKWMRQCSILFYCPHLTLIVVLKAVSPFFEVHQFILYITVLVCLSIMAFFILRLENKTYFKWLRNLY